MNNEIYELYQRYKINGNDTNMIHHLCAANRKSDAIDYIKRKTFDYEASKKIVDDYMLDNFDVIVDETQRMQTLRQEQLKQILNPNVPTCPTCSSTNLRKVSTTSKAVSVAVFGLFSQKVKKTWHCNNCGYEW